MQIGNGVATYLHFDATNSLLDPTGELLCELRVSVGGEASAAVNGHGIADGASHQGDERDTEELRFEIPERDIEAGNSHRCNAGASEIANATHHGPPASVGVERVLIANDMGERVANEFGG